MQQKEGILDQLSICGKILKFKRGLWNKELREKKLWRERERADYGEGSPEIELLIGADFCEQLFTGLIHELECGLIASKIYLGIKEPMEKTSREEVVKFFNDTLSTDFDGRYMWKDYEESKMKIYRHRRLIFGLHCNPFPPGAVINSLLENCPQEYLVIAEILKNCFYVDKQSLREWAVGSLVVRASDSRPEGLGSMLDVTKYPPSAHGFTCRNCGGGDRGRVAIYRPFGEVSLSLNRTVTCMVLKANDRRTSCPCHDEFRGPRSDYVRQVALATTTELMKLGSFELRGWENTLKNADSVQSHVLGLLWDQEEDLLFCDTSHVVTDCVPMPRRNVLSCIQKIFDPIGFTCPVTIVPKLLLQETWRKKIGWVERLPMHAEKKSCSG
ncbi:uncharacterized protein TNCV_1421961 [Trichonephila clavipes]|nr:uncharacterized protein TNCV_1421961 [Trichonephila clavipes]